MGIVYERKGIPNGGKQAEALAYFKKRADAIQSRYGVPSEVKVRLGGHTGEVILISRLNNLQELEDTKRQVIADTLAGKIPTAPEGVFASGEDAIWLEM